VHKHLRRLERVWVNWRIYFITTCTFERRRILNSNQFAAILVQEWRTAHKRHGWAIGRYVIMSDHVHFFCRAELSAKPLRMFMQNWNQWTNKRIAREIAVAGIDDPGAEREQNPLADVIFRSRFALKRKLQTKWEYVKENPIRAGLVKKSDD
jgi:REP element-mobilizing transposase RayT